MSENAFGGLLPPLPPAQHSPPPNLHSSPRVPMSERAEVTKIMLYAIYALSFAFTSHNLAALVEAYNGLRKCGIPAAHSLSPTSPLYAVILAFARTRPVEAYALAAENVAFALARVLPAHYLLRPGEFRRPAGQTARSIYLSKLFKLHMKRIEVLKELLRYVPRPRHHPQTSYCKNANQEKLESPWVL